MAHAVPARLTQPYSASAGRKFGLTVGGAFALLAAIARWRGHPTSVVVLGTLAILLIVLGLLIPAKLGPVERAWMRFAGLISKVTTPIVMGVVYFGVLTPIGLIRRLFGGKSLVHESRPTGFWMDRGPATRSSLDRQF